MKKRIIIPFALLFSVLVFGFVTLRSSQKPKTTPPCKTPMECCKKKCTESSTESPIWETPPHQFFSVIRAR